ncbi:MAG: EVE domain-containing protein [Candidatus Kaiserbacteria bacterium]|nr:EVE domain-containing protein [Candidatus Kaiserbacteria bacterium]
MSAKTKSDHKMWLMKSEPTEYSIDDLQCDVNTMWDGIRNYQVRNMMRDEMTVGDKALFYHSNTDQIGVVGEMEIAKKAYPDPTQFNVKDKHFDQKSTKKNPRWLCVDVRYIKKFPRIVTLNEMRNEKSLKDMKLLQKGSRLSITSVSKSQYEKIVAMAYKK